MFHVAFAIVAFGDLFNANELEVDVGQLVDQDVGVEMCSSQCKQL